MKQISLFEEIKTKDVWKRLCTKVYKFYQWIFVV